MVKAFHLGIEDMEPGNWVVWVFEFPGCYARASTKDGALKLVEAAIQELKGRLEQSSYARLSIPLEFTVVVAEEFRAFPSSPDYLANAFFEDDRIPLREEDIVYSRHLLNINRQELLHVSENLPAKVLDMGIEGEVQKTIRGILRHIGTAEQWYWNRLGISIPEPVRPDCVFELLEKVRWFTQLRIPEMVGSKLTTVRRGEQWSPRKLLRRTVWHERVHTLQIARYLKRLRPS